MSKPKPEGSLQDTGHILSFVCRKHVHQSTDVLFLTLVSVKPHAVVVTPGWREESNRTGDAAQSEATPCPPHGGPSGMPLLSLFSSTACRL